MQCDDPIHEAAASRVGVDRQHAVIKPDFSAAKFAHLFPAPFMAFVWPDSAELNEELRPLILDHASRFRGLEKSNCGGWHSEAAQLEFCGNAGRRLVRHMYEMGDEATRRTIAELPSPPMSRWTFRWTLRAWANVNGPGDFNRFHTHAGSTWSGTYYVDPGAPDDIEAGTPLHFFDPCQGRANTFLQPLVPARYSVRPEPGMMVLFPSYMPHMVFPHRGERQRISIAFNLRKEPFP